jgi:hypothetical protein
VPGKSKQVFTDANSLSGARKDTTEVISDEYVIDQILNPFVVPSAHLKFV